MQWGDPARWKGLKLQMKKVSKGSMVFSIDHIPGGRALAELILHLVPPSIDLVTN